jgi:hypothetical protein
MIRKTLIAAAAAATMALGLGAATAPANAGVNIQFGGGYYAPGWYTPVYHYGYGHHKRPPRHCHIKKVWDGYYWVKVKRCHRHW